MIVVMLITAVETTGDVFATGEIVEKRVGREDIARALRADGLATTIGGVFNSFPYTCFAENVGLVRLTQVKSRFVVAAAGVFMILIGLVPKAGAIVAGIPHPVLGGAALAMFATVAVVGFQILSRVDFHDHRNVVIVATSVGLAMYVTAQPRWRRPCRTGPRSSSAAASPWAASPRSCSTSSSTTSVWAAAPPWPASPGDAVRLGEVNEMNREEFVETFAGLFQGPRWVVERAYDARPFSDTHALRRSFQEALFSASREEQRQLIEAYPSSARGRGRRADGRGVAARPVRPRPDPARRPRARGARRADRGLPRAVRLPAGDFGPRRGLLRQDRRAGPRPPGQLRDQEHAAALIEIAKIAGYRFDDYLSAADPIHSARGRRDA